MLLMASPKTMPVQGRSDSPGLGLLQEKGERKMDCDAYDKGRSVGYD